MKLKRVQSVGAAVLIVILLALSTSLAWATQPSITVYKFDELGNPIPGWLIRLYKWDPDNGMWRTKPELEGVTGPDGSVTFYDRAITTWRVWEEARDCWMPLEYDGEMYDGYYIEVDVTEDTVVEFYNRYICQAAPGTGTPGYWKNHPDAWPVDAITIGGVTYTKQEAIATINTPERGDKTYTMFRALVAAKLNVLMGNDASCIAETIAAADDWMADNAPGSNVRGNSAAWMEGESLYEMLDAYNNGLLCAPARD